MKSNYKYFTNVALSTLFGVLVAFSASAQNRGGGGGRPGGGGGGGSHMSGGGGGFSGGGRSGGGFSGGGFSGGASRGGGGGFSGGNRGSIQSPGAGSYSRGNGGGFQGSRQPSAGYTPRGNSAPQAYSRGGGDARMQGYSRGDVRTQGFGGGNGRTQAYGGGGGVRNQGFGGRTQSYSRGGNVYSNSPQRVYANRGGGGGFGGGGSNVYRGRVTSAFGSRYGASTARVAYRDGYFHGSFYNGRYQSYNRFYGRTAYYNSFYYPRLGFSLSVLPYGYYPFYWGDYQYFYSGGYYYTYDNDNYTVVEPPMGAIMDQLPSGAKSLMIDGEQYYELNGIYYQAITKDDGRTGYQIAGKDGELTTAASVTDQAAYDQNPAAQGNADQAPIKIGDLFDSLPANTTAIKIDGQKYYVSPDGVYYQEDREGNRKVYRVAGTPDDQPK